MDYSIISIKRNLICCNAINLGKLRLNFFLNFSRKISRIFHNRLVNAIIVARNGKRNSLRLKAQIRNHIGVKRLRANYVSIIIASFFSINSIKRSLVVSIRRPYVNILRKRSRKLIIYRLLITTRRLNIASFSNCCLNLFCRKRLIIFQHH